MRRCHSERGMCFVAQDRHRVLSTPRGLRGASRMPGRRAAMSGVRAGPATVHVPFLFAARLALQL